MSGPSSLTLQGVPPVHGLGSGWLRFLGVPPFSPATSAKFLSAQADSGTLKIHVDPTQTTSWWDTLYARVESQKLTVMAGGYSTDGGKGNHISSISSAVERACWADGRAAIYLRDVVVVPSSHLINVVKEWRFTLWMDVASGSVFKHCIVDAEKREHVHLNRKLVAAAQP